MCTCQSKRERESGSPEMGPELRAGGGVDVSIGGLSLKWPVEGDGAWSFWGQCQW